jgi:hypothetical protein
VEQLDYQGKSEESRWTAFHRESLGYAQKASRTAGVLHDATMLCVARIESVVLMTSRIAVILAEELKQPQA